MKIKEMLVLAGIALASLIVLTAGIYAVDSVKNKKADNKSNDMTSMHAPPPPADNGKFQSLLNSPAPDFKLNSYDGKTVNLSDFEGKNVVLFFSEGAMCAPSCWDQINAFTNDKGFLLENTVVLTIVVDSKSDWEGAVKQDPKLANAIVLLDTDRSVSKSYGALTVDSSMHRGSFPGHSYIVIDKEGIVRFEKDDLNMGINNKELLSYISKLK